MNPKCDISEDIFISGSYECTITICGYDNSTAQNYAKKLTESEYAKDYNINFVSLGKAPEKETPTGNINGDEEFNVADVVLFQKYLLGMPDTTLSDLKNADLCADGRLDTFDLCIMKKKLVEDLV